MGLRAVTARVIRSDAEVDVPVDTVQIGDLIRVRPGEKVPVDGTLVSGHGSLLMDVMQAPSPWRAP